MSWLISHWASTRVSSLGFLSTKLQGIYSATETSYYDSCKYKWFLPYDLIQQTLDGPLLIIEGSQAIISKTELYFFFLNIVFVFADSIDKFTHAYFPTRQRIKISAYLDLFKG